MKLSAYLSPSRHGIYYFRWPIPAYDGCKRQTLKLSLKTRCPDRAGDLARYLASCGKLLKGNKVLASLRRDELKAKVRYFFQGQLEQYLDMLNRKELSQNALTDIKEEMLDHQSFLDIGSTYPQWLPIERFKKQSGISDAEWVISQPLATNELRRGRRDLLKAVLEAVEHLDGYSLGNDTENASKASQGTSIAIQQALDDFMAEYSQGRSSEMWKKMLSYLTVAIEHFGTQYPMNDITQHDATELKKIVQALPLNRNTKPETKGLPLHEAICVDGLPIISIKTQNAYIDAFKKFWDWSHRHGYVTEPLFVGMKIDQARSKEKPRKPFTSEHTQRLYDELTQNQSGLIKKDDHKWGALLGLFTGARLREIAQLCVSDIKPDDSGIWYIDINENGDNKSLKSHAAKRRIPLHSELIRLGFLDFVGSKPNQKRLFMSFSYNSKEGYGRNLGRWFNNSFLPKLGIKEKGLVFHSLRHTMTTRLAQAGVAEPLYQEIIGHERQGVTQQVYFAEGHTLKQKQEAIELFQA